MQYTSLFCPGNSVLWRLQKICSKQTDKHHFSGTRMMKLTDNFLIRICSQPFQCGPRFSFRRVYRCASCMHSGIGRFLCIFWDSPHIADAYSIFYSVFCAKHLDAPLRYTPLLCDLLSGDILHNTTPSNSSIFSIKNNSKQFYSSYWTRYIFKSL